MIDIKTIKNSKVKCDSCGKEIKIKNLYKFNGKTPIYACENCSQITNGEVVNNTVTYVTKAQRIIFDVYVKGTRRESCDLQEPVDKIINILKNEKCK